MKRLLIVHSSESFANALKNQLKGAFIVSCCTDGEEALTAVADLQPEVLVLHTALPQKDGITLLKQIPFCPEVILVTTNYLDDFVAYRLHSLGAMEVLLMPSVNTVLTCLSELLKQSRSLIPEEQTLGILYSLGFRPSLAGFRPLCQAAELLRKNPGQALSGEVYPLIGEPRAVEKAIRTAIHTAWREGDRRLWKKYFSADQCPGNKTFLMRLLQPDLHGTAEDHGVFRNGTVHG